ncbi:MAG: restriction endonuclease subunit S [Caldilineales bacterium]|nr:restriction endonuclease subunit S [Caldilineales bacterium]
MAKVLIKQGDFIFQVTFAWEGAVALASESEDGMYGSTRFPTYRVEEKKCDPNYLLLYFRTPVGRDQLVRISPGSAGRNRVLSLKRIPEVTIPLPPLAEQQRIVARIDALAARIEEAKGLRAGALAEVEKLKDRALFETMNLAGKTIISDFATVQSGYAFKSQWYSEGGIRLVRNANIGHGNIDWTDVKYLPARQANEYERFSLRENDILVSLDRPIISTGVKVVQVQKRDLPSLLVQRVGRILLKGNEVLPEYLFRWFQSPHFTNAIDPGRSLGVPHISQKNIQQISFVPPNIDEQRRIVAYLDDLQAKVDAVKRLQADTQTELEALLPSLLDRAFRGEL